MRQPEGVKPNYLENRPKLDFGLAEILEMLTPLPAGSRLPRLLHGPRPALAPAPGPTRAHARQPSAGPAHGRTCRRSVTAGPPGCRLHRPPPTAPPCEAARPMASSPR